MLFQSMARYESHEPIPSQYVRTEFDDSTELQQSRLDGGSEPFVTPQAETPRSKYVSFPNIDRAAMVKGPDTLLYSCADCTQGKLVL
jgi:hypothetical protein